MFPIKKKKKKVHGLCKDIIEVIKQSLRFTGRGIRWAQMP